MGKKTNFVSVLFISSLCCALSLYSCSGGGGDNDSDNGGISRSLLHGVNDNGAQTSPIVNAACRFVDGLSGDVVASDTTDSIGMFILPVDLGLDGVIECNPPGRPNLLLNTFATTIGRQPNEVVPNQDVTPATTVINLVINEEGGAEPENLKEALLAEVGIQVKHGVLSDGSSGFLAVPITANRNNNLDLLVFGATATFNEMLDKAVNTVRFEAALDDLFDDGVIDTPDLNPIKAGVEGSIGAAENQAVFDFIDIADASRTGAVAGMVLDAANNPVVGASVAVDGNLVQVPVSTLTDGDGVYFAEVTAVSTSRPLAAFDVSVTATASGVGPTTVQAVVVPSATTEEVDVIFPQADLVVTRLTQNGNFVVTATTIEVPIQVEIHNQGTRAADIFKAALEFTANDGTFGVAFTVPGEANAFYPFTDISLLSGSSVPFSGRAIFPRARRDEQVLLTAIADSCAGDEFMPEYCRVNESNEANNLSGSLSITLTIPVQ